LPEIIRVIVPVTGDLLSCRLVSHHRTLCGTYSAYLDYLSDRRRTSMDTFPGESARRPWYPCV
jgi:hypothetical protein